MGEFPREAQWMWSNSPGTRQCPQHWAENGRNASRRDVPLHGMAGMPLAQRERNYQSAVDRDMGRHD
jgi:hypothetical protein